jgi:hypothetical protein
MVGKKLNSPSLRLKCSVLINIAVDYNYDVFYRATY